MSLRKSAILLILLMPILISCGGNLEENKKKLDDLYGPCDNPQRPLSSLERDICMSKQRGIGPDGEMSEPFSLTDFINNRGNKQNVAAYQGVNQALWKSALHTLKNYPITSTDIIGGYIETDWIYDSNDNLQRCLIKIQITSTELISTGISTNFLCQIKKNDIWVSDNIEYVQESKDLNLKILSNTKLFN